MDVNGCQGNFTSSLIIISGTQHLNVTNGSFYARDVKVVVKMHLQSETF